MPDCTLDAGLAALALEGAEGSGRDPEEVAIDCGTASMEDSEVCGAAADDDDVLPAAVPGVLLELERGTPADALTLDLKELRRTTGVGLAALAQLKKMSYCSSK